MNDEVSFSTPADPYNFRLSLRHLRLDFSFQSQFTYSQTVTLNMTKVGIWQGDGVTVQVLKSNDVQLMLTICEPKTSKLSTILLKKLSEKDLISESNTINKLIMQIRNLTIYSTQDLSTNCTNEGTESRMYSAGEVLSVSILSTIAFFIAMCLTS